VVSEKVRRLFHTKTDTEAIHKVVGEVRPQYARLLEPCADVTRRGGWRGACFVISERAVSPSKSTFQASVDNSI
jgi:hypothetical protein